MTPFILIGYGGHGRVLHDLIIKCGYDILGVCDPNAVDDGMPSFSTQEVLAMNPDHVSLANGIGSVSIPYKRHAIYKSFKDKGFVFPPLIHPHSYRGKDVIIGEGVQIMAGCVIQTGVFIGENSIINTSSSIDHDCKIGVSCHIAPGVVFSGGVIVNDLCHIGTGVVSIHNITIAQESLIKAGTLLTRDVPSSQR